MSEHKFRIKNAPTLDAWINKHDPIMTNKAAAEIFDMSADQMSRMKVSTKVDELRVIEEHCSHTVKNKVVTKIKYVLVRIIRDGDQ